MHWLFESLFLLTDLKFSCPFFGPALYHHLGLGEKLDGMPSLSVEVPKEAIVPAAEWELCHGCSYSNVDPDITRIGPVTEGTGI